MTTALSLLKRSTFRVTLTALTAVIGVAMILPDAEARRLGGGRGFGRQSPNVTQQQAQPPAPQGQSAQQAAPAQPGMQKPPGAPAPNRWLGPLGGLAAGLGIAALLSHLGLIGPLAELLGGVLVVGLLALAGAAVWRLLRGAGAARPVQRAMEPAFGTAHAAGARPGSVAAEALVPAAPTGGAPPSSRSWGIPSDFDAETFLRSAKVHFLRLQAAWDAKNLADIREFTTPEVFAEIRMQMAEDGSTRNRTDVVTLDAELLGIEDDRDDYLASVRFSGTIREAEGGAAQPFEEVWNLSKPKNGRGGWLLAGLQQLSATDRPT